MLSVYYGGLHDFFLLQYLFLWNGFNGICGLQTQEKEGVRQFWLLLPTSLQVSTYILSFSKSIFRTQ